MKNSTKRYDPLHDDAQAMALVKRFRLNIDACDDDGWMVTRSDATLLGDFVTDDDLNRAICLCVAKMRQGLDKRAAGE